MFPLEQKNEHWNDQIETGPLFLIPVTPEPPLSENVFILYLFIFYLLWGEDG